jgi:hypothetical protein
MCGALSISSCGTYSIVEIGVGAQLTDVVNIGLNRWPVAYCAAPSTEVSVGALTAFLVVPFFAAFFILNFPDFCYLFRYPT